MIAQITQRRSQKFKNIKTILYKNDKTSFRDIYEALIKYNYIIVDIRDYSQIDDDIIRTLFESIKTYFTVESLGNLIQNFDVRNTSTKNIRLLEGQQKVEVVQRFDRFNIEKYTIDEISDLKLTKEGLVEQIKFGLSEIWSKRKMILKISVANFKLETKHTTLGSSWHIVKDIIFFITYFTFMLFLRGSGAIDGLPFIVFLMTGLLPWYFVSDVYNGEVFCIKKSKNMISKIGFPVTIIPVYSTLTAAYKRAMTYLLLFIVVAIYYFTGEITTIDIPLFIYSNIALIILMVSFVMMLSPIVALSKDLSELYKAIMRVQMYFVPIFWDMGMVSSKIENSSILGNYSNIIIPLIKINPVTYILSGFRASFGGTNYITPFYTISFWVIVLFLLIGGLSMQYKLKKYYADVL